MFYEFIQELVAYLDATITIPSKIFKLYTLGINLELNGSKLITNCPSSGLAWIN